ncbi:hypothetical protein C8Q75DRAFT_316028 [Abortiporus biennis]|nr:hypothetical protein C8Q75DRAFT_316028 [Abortiporus biennis]
MFSFSKIAFTSLALLSVSSSTVYAAPVAASAAVDVFARNPAPAEATAAVQVFARGDSPIISDLKGLQSQITPLINSFSGAPADVDAIVNVLSPLLISLLTLSSHCSLNSVFSSTLTSHSMPRLTLLSVL